MISICTETLPFLPLLHPFNLEIASRIAAMSNPVIPILRNKSSVSSLPVTPRAKAAMHLIISDAWADGRGIDQKALEKALAGAPNK